MFISYNINYLFKYYPSLNKEVNIKYRSYNRILFLFNQFGPDNDNMIKVKYFYKVLELKSQ